MKQRALNILIFLLAGVFTASAQLYPYNWRIGVSAGYSTYFGDLAPFQVNGLGESDKLFRLYDFNTNYIPQPSFQLSIEAKLSNTVGFALKGGRYSFAMADRFVNRKGELQTDTPRFIRSLNFKTDVTDIGISFLFSADNGKILNKKAFLAPYIGIGAGVLWYDVFADLYDSNGMPYDYTNLEVNYDGNYETELRPLRTEGVSYAQHAYYAELSLGLRFRLAHRWELFLQSDFRYTSTDYLDDVSGTYRASYATQEQQYAANPIGMPEAGGNNFRGNNNGLNDFYFFHGAGIKFSFGHRKESFRAPVVTGQHWESASSALPAPEPKRQLPRAESVKEPVDRRKAEPSRVKSDEELEEVIEPTLRFLEEEMVLLEMRERERSLLEHEDSLRNVKSSLDSLNIVLQVHLDSVPNDSLAQQQLAQRKAENDILRYQLDSLYSARVALMEDSILKSPPEETWAIQESLIVDTVRVKREIIQTPTDSLHRAEMNAMQKRMDRMQQQQAARDSVIIMRLADLLGERQQPVSVTEKSVTERFYTDTTTATPRSTPVTQRTQQADDIESLRREVRSLREAINRQDEVPAYTPSPEPGRDVTVVPGAPVIIREGGRDTLSASEYEGMQRERERLRAENEALRKELKQKEFELDLFLNPPKISEQPDSIDTLSTDNIPEPADTLQTAEPDTSAIDEAEILERLRETADEIEAETREKQPEGTAIEETPGKAESPDPSKSESEESPATEAIQVNVFFALNSTTVKESDRTELKKAADHWKKNKAQTISLTSYADNTGNPEYNRQLCERRNEAVKKVLVDTYGVEADKIKTEVGGKIVRNGKAWNPNDRRVEVVVRTVD